MSLSKLVGQYQKSNCLYEFMDQREWGKFGTRAACFTITFQEFMNVQCVVHISLYLHSNDIRMQWSIRKLWHIFSNERHWSRDGNIDIDFFDFLWVFHRFSIKRIIVHFAKRFSKFYKRPVSFHFPMQTKIGVLQSWTHWRYEFGRIFAMYVIPKEIFC